MFLRNLKPLWKHVFFQESINMKIVFSVNQREKYYFLVFINEIFPRLAEILFAGLRSRKILQETNIQNGLTKT